MSGDPQKSVMRNYIRATIAPTGIGINPHILDQVKLHEARSMRSNQWARDCGQMLPLSDSTHSSQILLRPQVWTLLRARLKDARPPIERTQIAVQMKMVCRSWETPFGLITDLEKGRGQRRTGGQSTPDI